MIKKMTTNPCSLNKEKYLCEWHSDLESGMEIWIQTSEDEGNPKWVRLGNLLEKIWFEHDCIPEGLGVGGVFNIYDVSRHHS